MIQGLRAALQSEQRHCGRDAEACEGLRQVVGGGGEDDRGAAGDQERGQGGPKEALGGEGGCADDQQCCPMSGRYAGHNCVQVIFKGIKYPGPPQYLVKLPDDLCLHHVLWACCQFFWKPPFIQVT